MGQIVDRCDVVRRTKSDLRSVTAAHLEQNLNVISSYRFNTLYHVHTVEVCISRSVCFCATSDILFFTLIYIKC